MDLILSVARIRAGKGTDPIALCDRLFGCWGQTSQKQQKTGNAAFSGPLAKGDGRCTWMAMTETAMFEN